MSETNTRRNVIIGAAAVVVIVAIAGVAYFFGGDAPEEATLEGAVAVARQEQGSTTAATEASPDTTIGEDATSTTEAVEDTSTTARGGIDGVWIVDTSVGEFSYENATSTFVGFRVAEELANIGATEAVGRTPSISGSIEIAGTQLMTVDIEADFTEITTNRSRRDGAVQRALDTATFPTATFTLDTPVDFGAVPADGEAVTVTAVGDLTVHGETQTVEFPIDAQVVGDLIAAVGQIEISLADFGVAVPSAPIVLSASDVATIEVQVFFSR